jgi:hypothetical protein
MHSLICPECEITFEPKTASQKYCSRKCWARKHYREFYRNNEDYRKGLLAMTSLRYLKRKQKGLCVLCGKEAIKGETKCLKCKNKANIKNKEWNQKNLLPKNQRRIKIISELGGKCAKCGYQGIALDKYGWNESKNFDELINKGAIQLLCANCHCEAHYTSERTQIHPK